jgi:hypothetical protein
MGIILKTLFLEAEKSTKVIEKFQMENVLFSNTTDEKMQFAK